MNKSNNCDVYDIGTLQGELENGTDSIIFHGLPINEEQSFFDFFIPSTGSDFAEVRFSLGYEKLEKDESIIFIRDENGKYNAYIYKNNEIQYDTKKSIEGISWLYTNPIPNTSWEIGDENVIPDQKTQFLYMLDQNKNINNIDFTSNPSAISKYNTNSNKINVLIKELNEYLAEYPNIANVIKEIYKIDATANSVGNTNNSGSINTSNQNGASKVNVNSYGSDNERNTTSKSSSISDSKDSTTSAGGKPGENSNSSLETTSKEGNSGNKSTSSVSDSKDSTTSAGGKPGEKSNSSLETTSKEENSGNKSTSSVSDSEGHKSNNSSINSNSQNETITNTSIQTNAEFTDTNGSKSGDSILSSTTVSNSLKIAGMSASSGLGLLDESGNPIYDEFGNPVYIEPNIEHIITNYKMDENGKIIAYQIDNNVWIHLSKDEEFYLEGQIGYYIYDGKYKIRIVDEHGNFIGFLDIGNYAVFDVKYNDKHEIIAIKIKICGKEQWIDITNGNNIIGKFGFIGNVYSSEDNKSKILLFKNKNKAGILGILFIAAGIIIAVKKIKDHIEDKDDTEDSKEKIGEGKYNIYDIKKSNNGESTEILIDKDKKTWINLNIRKDN